VSKTKKWQVERLNLDGTLLEGKSIGSEPKTMLKGELLIWRTQESG